MFGHSCPDAGMYCLEPLGVAVVEVEVVVYFEVQSILSIGRVGIYIMVEGSFRKVLASSWDWRWN